MAMTQETLTIPSGPLPLDVYSPAQGGKRAGVLILHGTLGLDPPFGPDIVSFAEALNGKGIAARIPHYFKSTGTSPGDDAFNHMIEHLPAWKAACGAVLGLMGTDPRIDATRIGLIGFSLGGHLALSVAMGRPPGTSIKGVVDFFGPTLQPALRGNWAALPPVLIHHGTLDPLSIEHSRHAVRELESTGRTVTPLTFGKAPTGPVAADRFIEYPGEKH